LSPALLGSTLPLLATLGCNVIISALSVNDQHDTAKEVSPMKITKKARLRKIAKIGTLAILTTVTGVVGAVMG